MRNFVLRALSISGVLGFAGPAFAADYMVHPEGTGEECTRAAPCALGTGAARAVAGDSVVLMDGVYRQGLNPPNSGTPEAWITFRADDCALPILEGEGDSVVPDENGDIPSGVYMAEATYLRFIGIVSRYWDTGFGNGWTGEISDSSNGHIEYINCIGDGNGRTAFAMYSARNFTVRECISAHNGGSPTHSWSSGVQLYAVQGAPEENVIERTVSFENVDAQKNNDGSGFIVDEETQGATFRNNLAFRNGGSCMRLTRSNNTRMSNFSCYHNGMNPDANSPTNPGELYWTDQQSRDTTTLVDSIAAASGSAQDPEALRFPPETGLSNNLTIDSGATPFFTDPDGINPDFRPPASAAAQVENLGTPSGGSDVDIGFDPKCIVKRDPMVPYQKSWWSYAIDYEYIRSIGGVAKCFHPKPRAGGADLGAYELSGDPHAFSTPGSCVPSTDPGAGGAGPGTGGASSGAGGSSSGAGGMIAGGTNTGGTNTGGSSGSGAQPGPGAGAGGAVGSGAGSTGVAGAGARAASNEGCSCKLAGRSTRSWFGAELSLLAGVAGLAFRRRRRRVV